MEYSIEIQTVPGIADDQYLDRLAELVYDLPGLVDPILGLNDDGSISADFCVSGESPMTAAQRAVAQFVYACAEANPLRAPTQDELARGSLTAASLAAAARAERPAAEAQLVGGVSVRRAPDRALLPA